MDSTGHGQRELVAVEDEVLIASWAINSMFSMRVQERIRTRYFHRARRRQYEWRTHSKNEILEHVCLSRMKAGRRAFQRT